MTKRDNSTILDPSYFINFEDGWIEGHTVVNTVRYIKDLVGFFEDESARSRLAQDTIAYSVQAVMPVEQGLEGGLFFGRTIVEPGKVGDEYIMTKGHIHEKANRAEYYWCIKGEGMLILMNAQRETRAVRMYPGSLHYIPGHTAHRTANTGSMQLIVGACWASDAGHDYSEIIEHGFSARLKDVDGQPVLVDEEMK